ncbi:MAG TPA: hypothetical protein PLF32_09350 [Bacteroidales bacterium]|nr:hypothetical protein [Bacteroidales bacterium]HOR82845.1 hypothetical protein [Bacteroidales bacterium]
MKQFTYILTLLLLASCGQPKAEQASTTASDTTTTERVDLKDRLKPIKANFKRINAISNWCSIETEELWETTEGGEAKFYYQKGILEKIVTHHYGETFQLLTEYYLLNGELSFVFAKHYQYNRHVYYDSTAMVENNDTEVFDVEKSKITEKRSYFENGKLFHQINQESDSPLTDDYLLQEEKEIKTYFDQLIGMTKKK